MLVKSHEKAVYVIYTTLQSRYFDTNAFVLQSEGGGCGVGLGLGWGFGTAYGSKYHSPGFTFQGVEFASEGKGSKNLLKNTQKTDASLPS